jgi:hypothetical protein
MAAMYELEDSSSVKNQRLVSFERRFFDENNCFD